MAVAGLAAVAVEAGVTGPRRLVTREVNLSLPDWPAGLDGVRVALVADLHAGAPGVSRASVSRVVERVRVAAPDLVLLLGDYLADVPGGRRVSPGDVATALAPLARVAPVAAVLGNHDWCAGGHRVRAALRDAGFPVLEETSLRVAVRGCPLWLAGVGDLWERRPDVTAALWGIPPRAPTIVLAHNPDCALDVPRWVALTVSGHTHGGQVSVWGRPLHVVSPFTGNRFLRGAYEVGGRRLYVSPGIGTSSVPLRLGGSPWRTDCHRMPGPPDQAAAVPAGDRSALRIAPPQPQDRDLWHVPVEPRRPAPPTAVPRLPPGGGYRRLDRPDDR